MTTLTEFYARPEVHTLGWTLFHFLWQGTLVAVLLASILGLLPGKRSQLRYIAACFGLVLMVVLPVVTWRHLASAPRTVDMQMTKQVGNNQDISLRYSVQRPSDSWLEQIAKILDRSTSWAVSLWLAGVVLLLGRLNIGLIVARRMKFLSVQPVPLEWQTLFLQVTRRLKIARTIKLAYSVAVEVPTVIGWLRPVILIPVGCMVGLSTSQLEALLAHELAHVLRHDYLVNIFQSVVETLLFYHPAVWWISKQIRKEREHCCDDLAVGVSGDSLGYAKALSLLAEHRSSLPAVVLGANGGALAMRIKRLLGCQDSPSFSRLAAVVLMATTFLTVGLGIGAAVRADSSTGAVIDGNKNSRDLPAQYQRWLNEDVRWIITPEERAAFSQLSRNEERDKFVVQFWLRRSPTPDTAENKFKEEHYRRLAYANTHFAASAPGWNTDRGRTYIVHGPPDEIDAHPGHNGEKPTEIWRYYSIRVNEPPDQPGADGQVGYRAKVVDKKNVDMKFVDVCNCGDYRLESAPVE